MVGRPRDDSHSHDDSQDDVDDDDDCVAAVAAAVHVVSVKPSSIPHVPVVDALPFHRHTLSGGSRRGCLNPCFSCCQQWYHLFRW